MALIDNHVAFFELASTADAHGANTLSNTGSTTFVAGKVGNCANFASASSQRLSITDNAALSMGDIACAWDFDVYLTSKPAAVMAIMGKYNSTTNQREYLFDWANTTDRFRFIVSGDGSAATVLTCDVFGAPTLATWYHVHLEHDPIANALAAWINNVAETPVAHTTGVFDGTSAFMIGARSNTTPDQFFNGRVDQFAIRKALYTTEERDFAYNGGASRTYAEFLAGIPSNNARRSVLQAYMRGN